jgi:hypothetical protein
VSGPPSTSGHHGWASVGHATAALAPPIDSGQHRLAQPTRCPRRPRASSPRGYARAAAPRARWRPARPTPDEGQRMSAAGFYASPPSRTASLKSLPHTNPMWPSRQDRWPAAPRGRRGRPRYMRLPGWWPRAPFGPAQCRSSATLPVRRHPGSTDRRQCGGEDNPESVITRRAGRAPRSPGSGRGAAARGKCCPAPRAAS